MSLKGTVLTPDTVARSIRADLMRKATRQNARNPDAVAEAFRLALDAYVTEHNERYRVVAQTDEGMPLIAEELEARALQRLSPKARRVATAILLAAPAVRVEVLKAFDAAGGLVIPFGGPEGMPSPPPVTAPEPTTTPPPSPRTVEPPRRKR